MKKLDVLKNKLPLGTRTGKLVVEGYSKYGKPPHFWLLKCRCDCGIMIEERPNRLMLRRVKSCGCTRDDFQTERFRAKYPVGTVFGHLTVIGYSTIPFAETQRNGAVTERRLVCRCSCGKEKCVLPKSLVCGATISCGCVGLKHRIAAMRIAWKLEPGVASMNAVYGKAKSQAAHRGLVWNITIDEFHRLAQGECHYCGSMASKSYTTKSSGVPFVYNGIDRLDSTRGYVRDNVVACCKNCNYAKHKLSVEEFKEWLHRAATYYLGMK